MKLSQFNSVLPYFGNYLLHNAYSDYYILVNPILKELLEAASNENNISGMEQYHPSFFKELLENGFVIDDNVDEVAEIKELVNLVDSNQSNYILTINPTMGCNFNCWYCYESHIRGSKMDVPIINKILKFINNEITYNKKLENFNLAFFGGEPLLYFEQTVVPILEGATKMFKDSNIHFCVGFTTNGFLINQEKIDFLKGHNVESFQITLDGNREFHDKVRFVNSERGSYDKIVGNIKCLAKNELNTIMRINFTRDNFLSCLSIPNDFADLEEEYKKYILVDFHQVWQDNPMETPSLSPILNSFMEAGFTVNAEATALNNIVESCYADKRNSATINFNGEVFKCTARDFTIANSLGILSEEGKIKWNLEYEKRQNAKFNNAPCLECRLLPICNGGCSQHAYENLGKENGYCVFGFDEQKKDALILERFRLRTMQQQINAE